MSILNKVFILTLLKTISSRNETCLERGAASSRATPKELDHTKGGPPGQRYPADAQCQLAHGKGFRATPSKRVSQPTFSEWPAFFCIDCYVLSPMYAHND